MKRLAIAGAMVAALTFGAPWRMPTNTEFSGLINNCPKGAQAAARAYSIQSDLFREWTTMTGGDRQKRAERAVLFAGLQIVSQF